MKKIHKIITSFVIFISPMLTHAQEISKDEHKSFFNTNIDYQVKAQLTIGGASPLGIPAQIRKIESFEPRKAFNLEVNATKWLDLKQRYGIRTGVRLDGRGMKTQAKVKNYYTQIADDTGAQTTGYFTGHVVTEVKNTYLTVPVLFVWNATEKWNFYGGFYLSKILQKSFGGYIYDGDFREGSPIGELTTFEGTAHGIYDFSDDLSSFQWGNQLGAEYKINKNLLIALDVTMANSQIFKKDFESITFKMYNIYGSLGIGYNF